MAAGGIKVHVYGDYDDKDINKAIKDLQSLKTQAGAPTTALGGLSGALKSVGVAAAAFVSFNAVADFFKESAANAIEDERSLRMLNTTLSNLGFAAATDEVAAFVDQTQATYGFLDDDLRPALARLVRSTNDVAQAEKVLQTAMDISVGTGKSLDVVAAALGKAYDGNAASLGRLGLGLDKATLKSANMAEIMPKLNQMFGGQAAAAADTYEGKLKRISIAADEAKETIGYALLNALDKLSQSFGGTGGIVAAITAAGESMANFITGVGLGANAIVDFFARTSAAIASSNVADETDGLTNFFKSLVSYLPGVGLANTFTVIGEEGAKANAETQRFSNSMRALGDRYTALSASLTPTAQKTKELANAQEDAKASADRLKAAINSINSALSNSQSIDDWRKSLADLDETLKKNPRSFKGMGDAAKENRDTLRTALGDASKIAQQWVDDGKITADQYQAAYKGLAKKVVNQFVADGFKRSDIAKFLGDQGLWTGPITKNLSAAQRIAYLEGMATGKALTDGITIGIAQGTPGVVHQSGLTILSATRKANEAAGIQSPSKVWAEMGGHLVDGLIVGMKSKDSAVQQKAQETMQALSDKAGEILTKWDEKLSRLKGRLDERTAELADAAKSVSSAIMEGLNFSAANDMTTVGEDGQQVGMSFIAGLQAQAEQVKNFASKVKELIQAGLSQAGIQQVLAAGMTAGTAIATELIKGGANAINTTNALVSSTQEAADEVGLMAGTSWYGAGVTSAQQTYEGFAKNFGKDGPARKALENLMDRVAASLDRTATITVKTVYEAAGLKPPGRAVGGPVGAGMPYIVGEKGPELFVPNMNGTIIPNGGGSGGGSMGGGTTVNITVNAGLGTDGYSVGKSVVDAIKKYERVSGPVFAAA